jgi:hypothetical protein
VPKIILTCALTFSPHFRYTSLETINNQSRRMWPMTWKWRFLIHRERSRDGLWRVIADVYRSVAKINNNFLVLKMARTKKSTIQSTPKGKLRCKNQLAAARYARQCLKTAEEQLISIASDPVSETSLRLTVSHPACRHWGSVISTWTENTISVQKGIVCSSNSCKYFIIWAVW